MRNKKSVLSMVVALAMLLTAVIGNVGSVYAEDDEKVNIGDSFIIDEVVDGTPSYKGGDDNVYSKIGTSALYAVAGTKDVKITKSKKTYDGVTYTYAVTTASKGDFDSTTNMPKQCAIKFTPSRDCKAVIYASEPNAAKKNHKLLL